MPNYQPFRAGTALASSIVTTMLRFTERRRELLADTLPDAANVALGALVFGQFLGDRPYSLVLAVAGVAIWFLLIVMMLLIAEERT